MNRKKTVAGIASIGVLVAFCYAEDRGKEHLDGTPVEPCAQLRERLHGFRGRIVAELRELRSASF